MDATDFTFEIDESREQPVIMMKGRLMDKESATDLSSALERLVQGGKNNLVFDMSKLEYLNSMGLNLMVNYLTKVRNAGGEIAVAGVSDKVSQLLVVTKLNTLFPVYDDVSTALNAKRS